MRCLIIHNRVTVPADGDSHSRTCIKGTPCCRPPSYPARSCDCNVRSRPDRNTEIIIPIRCCGACKSEISNDFYSGRKPAYTRRRRHHDCRAAVLRSDGGRVLCDDFGQAVAVVGDAASVRPADGSSVDRRIRLWPSSRRRSPSASVVIVRPRRPRLWSSRQPTAAAVRTRRRSLRSPAARGRNAVSRLVLSLRVRGGRPADRGREESERSERRPRNGQGHVQPGRTGRVHPGGGVLGRRRARVQRRSEKDRTAAQVRCEVRRLVRLGIRPTRSRRRRHVGGDNTVHRPTKHALLPTRTVRHHVSETMIFFSFSVFDP